jgi:hypothetical protein
VFPLLGFVFGIFVVLVLQEKSESCRIIQQSRTGFVSLGFDEFGVPWFLSFLLGCGDFIFLVCGGLSADDVL